MIIIYVLLCVSSFRADISGPLAFFDNVKKEMKKNFKIF